MEPLKATETFSTMPNQAEKKLGKKKRSLVESTFGGVKGKDTEFLETWQEEKGVVLSNRLGTAIGTAGGFVRSVGESDSDVSTIYSQGP